MSGAAVPVPLAVAGRMLAFISAMSSREPSWSPEEAQCLTTLLGEAISITEDLAGPDHEALLDELIQALALHSGRHFVPTLDRAGVDAALAVLADMAPALGALGETKDWLPLLREAVKVQDTRVTLRVFYPPSKSTGKRLWHREVELPCACVPRRGDEIELDDGLLCFVFAPARHRGLDVLVTAQITTEAPSAVPTEEAKPR